MPPAAPLVGRTSELAALEEALGELERGRPSAIELVGPAGIGKTRLLAELGARADARGHLVLAGAASELERDLPFWVFVDALDEYVERLDPRRLERMDEARARRARPDLPGAVRAAGPARAGAPRALPHATGRCASCSSSSPPPSRWSWCSTTSTGPTRPPSTWRSRCCAGRPPPRVLLALGARPRQLPARLASALERAHRDGTLSRIELGALNRDEARALLGRRAEDRSSPSSTTSPAATRSTSSSSRGRPAGRGTAGGEVDARAASRCRRWWRRR